MFVWPWVVNLVLRIGWKDKDVTWIVGICTICVRHLTTTFEDDHCFLDTGVVMPVKSRTAGSQPWVIASQYGLVACSADT